LINGASAAAKKTSVAVEDESDKVAEYDGDQY
jgi:hypothetical protein